MYEIIDNKGVLFSGDEEGMSHIFDINDNNFYQLDPYVWGMRLFL